MESMKPRSIHRSVSTDLSRPLRPPRIGLPPPGITRTSELNEDGSPRITTNNELLVPLNHQLKSRSDTNLLASFLAKSSLTLDRQECFISNSQQVKIKITYDILESVHSRDWVGVYLNGETSNPTNRFDYKLRTQNNNAVLTNHGEIYWDISKLKLPFFAAATTVDICFCYYQVTDDKQVLLATSDVLTVHRSPEESKREAAIKSPQITHSVHPIVSPLAGHTRFVILQFSDLLARGLKRSSFFNLMPYVKFTVEAGRRSLDAERVHSLATPSGHYHNVRKTATSSGADPSWSDIIEVKLLLTDKLVISVRNKSVNFAPMKRCLGELILNSKSLVNHVHNGDLPSSYTLSTHCPANIVTGTLSFNLRIIPEIQHEIDDTSIASTTDDDIPLIVRRKPFTIKSIDQSKQKISKRPAPPLPKETRTVETEAEGHVYDTISSYSGGVAPSSGCVAPSSVARVDHQRWGHEGPYFTTVHTTVGEHTAHTDNTATAGTHAAPTKTDASTTPHSTQSTTATSTLAVITSPTPAPPRPAPPPLLQHLAQCRMNTSRRR